MDEENKQIKVTKLLQASKMLMDENDMLKKLMKLNAEKLKNLEVELRNQNEELKILKEENLHLKATPSSSMNDSKKEETSKIMREAFLDVLRTMQLNINQNTADEVLKMTMIKASLPELPKFSGSYEEWPLFEKIFNLTNETGNYTEELNHLRFKKCLDGEAKKECQRLLNSMSSGTSIMNHLKSVYGDPEKILNLQVKKLLKMKAPQYSENHQLKDFVNELEAFVINAENLEKEDFLKQPSVIDQLIFKLKDRHQDDWKAIKLANPSVNLRDLWKFLADLSKL